MSVANITLKIFYIFVKDCTPPNTVMYLYIAPFSKLTVCEGMENVQATVHSRMKCGDMLVTCSVNRGESAQMVWIQPLLLFELSMRESIVQPSKVLEKVRHLYTRFPGNYTIMVMRIFTVYVFQALHIEDSGSILNQNAFNVFRVHYSSSLSTINSELQDMIGVEKMGHSILCTDGSCKSPLRLLKQASTHHSTTSPLLRSIYSARCASNFISDVDTAMNKGDIQKLMKLGQCENVFKEPFEADTVTVTTSRPAMDEDNIGLHINLNIDQFVKFDNSDDGTPVKEKPMIPAPLKKNTHI